MVFDTGAMILVTSRKADFISWDSSPDPFMLHGITATTDILGVGIVRWTICDDTGKRHLLEMKAYYVPKAQVRLLSPQRLLHEYNDGSLMITPNTSVF